MDRIIKNMQELELDEIEQKELKEIINNMETGLVYRSFRVTTTGSIAAKLGYIIDTEYPAYEISFQNPKHKHYRNKDKIILDNFGSTYPHIDYQNAYFRTDYKVFCDSPDSYNEIAKKNTREITQLEISEISHSSTEICRFCYSVDVSIKLKTGK